MVDTPHPAEGIFPAVAVAPAAAPEPVGEPTPAQLAEAEEQKQTPLQRGEALLADLQHRVRTNSGINDWVIREVTALVEHLRGKA